ncbi:MAG: hypothetical protein QOC93_2506 [Actinomycetota bacterium]|jgi:hypothetical protein|nr:hypothetical protein [Cryptosporangiaceae bacterium]MDQ1677362.1 hypothetical protein [Actinomycetota bacterium]
MHQKALYEELLERRLRLVEAGITESDSLNLTDYALLWGSCAVLPAILLVAGWFA